MVLFLIGLGLPQRTIAPAHQIVTGLGMRILSSQRRIWATVVLAILCGATVVGTALAADQHGLTADSSSERRGWEWRAHGRDDLEQRYSTLDLINVANVATLGLAWFFDLDEHDVVEATPLVVDGVMYVVGPWGETLYALDAETGRKLWTYDAAVPRETLVRACCQPVNRGAAWDDGKVYFGTLDGRLIAVEAKSGRELWQTLTVDPSKAYTITGAPRVIKGKVIIGNAGAEYDVRGYVSAYDAKTGKLLWRFFTVPGNPADGFENAAMEMAAATWTGEWWRFGGGGTVWDGMAYDPDLNLLYIGVGNGTPWDQKIRSPGGGDNLFLASIVALNPDTGEYVWHYQTTPGENWDFTATQPIILADIAIDGAVRKVLMQAPKNGFFYVVDRATGELISAEPIVSVSWATHVDRTTGRPVETPGIRDTGDEPKVVSPGPSGAHNWNPMAFSPSTGLVYIPTLQSRYFFKSSDAYAYVPGFWNLGFDISIPMSLRAQGQEQRSTSFLLAWDPVSQTEKWRADGSGGGALATAGGLVFRGLSDGRFAAYDAATGRALWTYQIQNSAVAGPISFRIGDDQYIAVAVGRGAATLMKGPVPQPQLLPHANRVLAFKLGGSATLPAYEFEPQSLRTPPNVELPPAQVARGRFEFHRFCFACHGREATGNKIQPDLRYSEYLDNGLWHEVVLEGALSGKGMVSFSSAIDESASEAIRLYVISEAQKGGNAGVQLK
ncbi:MAG: PQQ-dependent dehydrogenase, methanol/ethanol family [Rhodospirillaceae bacterium]|nr:PQQ-dependent dehydrogenase, methanol/ethanol family [Rhodospirillaceae bacterium]